MAVIKPANTKSIRGTMKYVSKMEKTTINLMSGVNCSNDPEKALQQMLITKKVYGKTDGRSCIHFIQSFAAAESVTADEVHQVGLELVNRFPLMRGYQIFITTHLDQKNKNLHNHIIISSVNMITAKKWQMSSNELADLRPLGDDICREHGLTITIKGKTFEGIEREDTVSYKKETYRYLTKAEQGKVDSYVQTIALAVMDAKEKAISQDDFIERLRQFGIGVDWSDTRKYIVFCDLERQKAGEAKCKIRNKKLKEYYNIDLEKEVLLNEFEKNARRNEAERAARNLLSGRIDAGISSNQAGESGFEEQAQRSICEDRELDQLGLGVAASTAARAERERAERERREADERARAAAERQRAEERRLAEQRAAAEKAAKTARGTRKKSRNNDWSL